MSIAATVPDLGRRAEDGASSLVLMMMVALPLTEVVGRTIWERGIPNSIPLVEHLTLWIAFMGAALAARSNRLLALATTDLVPERFREPMRLASHAMGSALAAWLCWAGVRLAASQMQSGHEVGLGIPVWLALCILPLGLGLVSLRLLLQASRRWSGRLLAAGVPALLLVMSFDPPPASVAVPLGVALILLAAALSMPIFAVVGGLALLLFWGDGVPLASVPDEAYRLSASPLLPAVPLFTLGGSILSEGAASRRVLRLFSAWFGWMPGGLAIVTTLVLAFFTPLTGASGVTILSMGGLLLPVLVRAGYSESHALGLVTVAGSIGLLLPPSLPVILYGVGARVSIMDLFIGGLVPGVLLIALVAAWGARKGVQAGIPRTPFHAREAVAALWAGKWEALLPVLILGAIFGGIMTLVEAAALTVLYALVVESLLHRSLSVVRDVPRILTESVTLSGGFLVILGMALALTGYLVDAEVPMRVLALVQAHIESPLVFLLALNLFLVIVGGLMDIYSAIFVVVPLITPIAAAYGIDGVHLGIIFLANLELGYLTPPMGENLFLSSYRFKKPLGALFRSTLPLWIILFIGVMLITYIPFLTLGLVNWLKG